MRNLSNLGAARTVNSTASIRDQVNSRNPVDVFRFSLGQASSLNLKFRSAGPGASLRLIQDRNANGRVDAGEMLRSARLSAQQKEVNLPQTAAGTYFLQVAGGQTARYQLNLTSTALPPNNTAVGTPPPSPSAALSLVDQIVALTNNFRRQNGLAPVALNAQLSAAAQSHSQNMAQQDYFDHISPTGSTPGQRATAAGYRWSRVAENIGAGHTTADSVVQGWITSPGHRANLLDARVREIGVGYFFLANDTGSENWNHYWTQVFAEPM